MTSPPTPTPGPRRARRGRRTAAGLAALLAAGALAGCQVDNTPTSYDGGNNVIRANYVAACTGKIPNQPSTSIMNTDAACECQFDVFKAKVPYNAEDRVRVKDYPADKPTFHDLDNQTKDEPSRFGDLPEAIRKELDECGRAGLSGPVAGPGTTAAPGTTAPG